MVVCKYGKLLSDFSHGYNLFYFYFSFKPHITDRLIAAVLFTVCGRLSLSVGTHSCDKTGKSFPDSF